MANSSTLIEPNELPSEFHNEIRNALRKHIVGESEHLSKSVFECFSPWFAEELAA